MPGKAAVTPGGIAVVNASDLLIQAAALAMVDAVAVQCIEFCRDWSRLLCEPSLYGRIEDVPDRMATIVIVNDSDQADALGYHTEYAGVVSGIVAVRPILSSGGTILSGSRSVSCVLSHEVLEPIVDPFCNSLARAADGRKWPIEVCDAVEGNSYEIGEISVSDYLLPAWVNWSPPSDAKFNVLGTLSGPFSLAPGGYAMVEEANGVVTEVGAARPVHRPETHYSRSRKRRQ